MPDAALHTEEARNRRLRRADWRFLLPDPCPARSVCYANGLLAEAVEAISTEVARPQSGLRESCDLAVAVNPDAATLQAALTALRPGGACYTEWSSPLSGGWRGVQRRLVGAGFEAARVYWAWPLPSRGSALFWLPLDAPHALDYFLSSRPRPNGVARGLLGRLQQRLWRVGQQANLLLPVYAVAHKPNAMPGQGYVGPATSETQWGGPQVLRKGWEAWGLRPGPAPSSWLLLTGGRRSINKPVALVFAHNEALPRAAVKMTRVPESVPPLVHEAEVLRALQADSGPVLPGVPRVLFDWRQGDIAVVGETALSGAPLWTKLKRSNYRQLALQATDWLTRLAHRSLILPRQGWWEERVHLVLETFAAQYGTVVATDDLDLTRRSLATLGALPLVCEQRDFSPWNVLVQSDGGLVVLDWESAELEGWPALDLLYGLTYLAFYLDGAMASGQTDASYQASLDPTTLTGAVRSQCLARYSQALELDPRVLRPLRLLVWLLHARSEYERLAADAGRAPSPKRLRDSLFVRLWQAEVRHMRLGNE